MPCMLERSGHQSMVEADHPELPKRFLTPHKLQSKSLSFRAGVLQAQSASFMSCQEV